MSFIRSIFPSKPTSAAAAALVENLKSALRATCAEIAENDKILTDLAALTDAEHASAEAALAAATRRKARLEAQIAEAEAARVAALKAEARQDLFARRDAAEKRVSGDYLKTEARLRKAFQEGASAASEMVAIDAEVEALNREIKAARKADKDGTLPDLITTSDQRYRSGPDIVTEASTFEREGVAVHGDHGPVPVGIVARDADGMIILGAGQFMHTFVTKNPEQRRTGARMMAPTSELRLPAIRLGEAAFWPPEGR